MDIKAVSFPYETTVVSRKQFDEHIQLYNGYVQKTNESTNILKTNPEYPSANATGGHYRGWKKTETYAINGVILHELYFQNLGNKSGIMGTKMTELANRYFGSVENWKADFIACATSARGWCVFLYEQRTNTCRNILLDWHDYGNIVTAYPIIVLDMYEHAYFIDYGKDKNTYIKNFISTIPWGIIEKRAGAIV